MGRSPCCDKSTVKKGPWSAEEDAKLKNFIYKHGNIGNWIALPKKVGLKRCGKSCRLRWLNYLRPNIKHGDFSIEEDRIICSIYAAIGSRWSFMASQLPGRTDNDIKNYWNTKLKKKIMNMSNMNMIGLLTTTQTNPLTTFQYGGGSVTIPYCVPQFNQGFQTPNPLLAANHRSFLSHENLEYPQENSTVYQSDYKFEQNNEETGFLNASLFDQETTCSLDDYQLIDVAFLSNDSNSWVIH